RYHHFYGDSLRVECPTGSGRWMNLGQVAGEIGRRLASLFLADSAGRRPFAGDDAVFSEPPHARDLVLFHGYVHGETGRGLGASPQPAWARLWVRLTQAMAGAMGHAQPRKVEVNPTATRLKKTLIGGQPPAASVPPRVALAHTHLLANRPERSRRPRSLGDST